MSAGKYDFRIEQGATFYQAVVWKDSSGAAVDLTNYTARMQVRDYSTATELLLDLSSGSGIEITPLEGKVALLVSATDTAAITWTAGRYDLEVEDSSGHVTRILQGMITVSPEVTR